MESTMNLRVCASVTSGCGLTISDGRVVFSLYAPETDCLSVCFFDDEGQLCKEVPFDPFEHRTEGVWHLEVKGLHLPIRYRYRMGDQEVIDPYAREVEGEFGILPAPSSFSWGIDRRPLHHLSELIIYEMHVKGFTADRSSGVKHPGTFHGVIEKIPYLLELGINAVELMPVQHFDRSDGNYWGYATEHFFAPMGSYGSAEDFKAMVIALHDHGIEVILDVVFNHTGEKCPWRVLAPNVAYIRDENGEDTNYTGCGNTLNANHPVMVEYIRDCLRYWVTVMHVDGFRFDLASSLTRGLSGEPLENPPLIQAISEDPLLAKTKLIAEPWDPAGLYHVGHFGPKNCRWAEWNGQFRDDVRGFIKGDAHTAGAFAARLCGSKDLYAHKAPWNSVNFITSHDGFSLADLVAYNGKHNEANQEDNRDGDNHNLSWNCGAEGETENEEILQLRQRQRKNFLVALFVAQGVPMLTMSDEVGHSKRGNNNTWRKDNLLSWLNWERSNAQQAFYRFCQKMIALKLATPEFKQQEHLSSAEIEWLNPDWQGKCVALIIGPHLVAFNAHHEETSLILPSPDWVWLVNTANPTPKDFYDECLPAPNEISLMPYSSVILTKE